MRDGSFWWEGPQFYCLDGSQWPNCSRPDQKKVIINGEHFDASGTQWWYQNFSSRMSAVGYDGSTLVLAASQGGISNASMANVLVSQGVKYALRLDGGGSTQLYSKYAGAEVDLRSWDSPERTIANGLLVFIRDVPGCPAPNLREPGNGYVSDSSTFTFRWDDVSCSHNGFTFRVRTTPDMELNGSGETVIDTGEGGTSRTVAFGSRWNERDLYWSVRAANAPGGASWSPARVFRISPNRLPTITFDTANGNGDNRITSRYHTWTFRGTAGDPENRFSRVEFRCDDCDNRGNGEDRSTSTNWAITRNGMSGRNYVFFEAFDDKQSTRSAKTLELNIDLAPPATNAHIVGAALYGWFTEPAQVRLTAQDGNTGRASAGVREKIGRASCRERV